MSNNSPPVQKLISTLIAQNKIKTQFIYLIAAMAKANPIIPIGEALRLAGIDRQLDMIVEQIDELGRLIEEIKCNECVDCNYLEIKQ
ncbi:hypothetical protein ACFBZI_07510 [Moraxella sp. ZJ142]|uniref:hypothetical protein n=1 Tax=Moraxella marmotae TaxID=3344520 RepID=UPI0035D45B14